MNIQTKDILNAIKEIKPYIIDIVNFLKKTYYASKYAIFNNKYLIQDFVINNAKKIIELLSNLKDKLPLLITALKELLVGAKNILVNIDIKNLLEKAKNILANLPNIIKSINFSEGARYIKDIDTTQLKKSLHNVYKFCKNLLQINYLVISGKEKDAFNDISYIKNADNNINKLLENNYGIIGAKNSYYNSGAKSALQTIISTLLTLTVFNINELIILPLAILVDKITANKFEANTYREKAINSLFEKSINIGQSQ